jgi:uncharacterized membrane protein YfcA
MSWLDLLLIPLGLAVGTFGTLVGAGGGFILVPVLLLLFPDEDPEVITSMSLAVVFFNAASGSVAYLRQNRVDIKSGLIFAAASLPSAVGGAFLVSIIPRRFFDGMFGVTLLVLAAYIFWVTGRPQAMRTPQRGRFVIHRTLPGSAPEETYRYSYHVWYGALLSAGIGLMSSVLGIGGGVIHVPVMITVLRFPVHVATATSHFVLMFMTGEASAVHLLNGTLQGEALGRALLLAVGVIPGAQVGAMLSQRLHGPLIVRILAASLVLVAARLLFAAGVG